MPGNIKYRCQQCGYESAKWLGRCPGCEAWNSLAEEIATPPSFGLTHPSSLNPQLLSEVKLSQQRRHLIGIAEFDRVLGGGLVPGSLVLIGGDPGIGKSTLLIQAAAHFSRELSPILYVSGEESLSQIKLRADRLGVNSDRVYLLAETNLEFIINVVERLKPKVIIIDSIQTVYRPEMGSSPGSVAQVRECTSLLMRLAKSQEISAFLVGHVTKEGAIAGPRVLEHMVDTVLYFEGKDHLTHRILRTVKNRFGSVSEIGVFSMEEKGLMEILNPSASFLAQRPHEAPGSVVYASMEGTRPILVEIQALVSPTSFGLAKREAIGVDYNRVSLLLSVLEKRLGLHLGNYDCFVNVAGGIRVTEPGADLGIVAAIVSNHRNQPIDEVTVILGEVGLAGEVRAISQLDRRLLEIIKLGFSRCICPQYNLKNRKLASSIELIGVTTVEEALSKMGLW
ncbi:MAG: DNA repair protein RadA [bacterium]